MGWQISKTKEYDMTCMKTVVFLNKIHVKLLYLYLQLCQ